MKGSKSEESCTYACEVNVLVYLHAMVHFCLLPIFFASNNVRATGLARLPGNVCAKTISVVKK